MIGSRGARAASAGVELGELADAGAELLERVEALDLQDLFLEGLQELLDGAVGLGLVWREATAPAPRWSERYEDKRREVAEHLASCGSLRGASRVEVLRRLGSTGSGQPDARTRADGRHTWHYYLGPDSQRLDDENLSVTFDDRDRAVQFRVIQS